MGSYGTSAAATLSPAFLIRPQTRVRLGTGGLADLETTSWLYSTYSASIGLANGKGLDLGLLAALAWRLQPSIEAVAGINYQEETVFEVTGEECEVSLTLREFHIDALAQAIATGVVYTIGDPTEALLTFGGSCTIKYYPLVVEFSNVGCQAPATAGLGSGITGGILTLYKTAQINGIDWAAVTAKEGSSLELVYRAVPDTTKSKGNRLGNLYLY
jgi:hypothetical protein